MSETNDEIDIKPQNGWKTAAIIEALIIYFLSVSLAFLVGKVYF